MTIDARAVIARVAHLAVNADRRHMTLEDLAGALSVPSGNTAELWPAQPAEPPPTAEPTAIEPVEPPAAEPLPSEPPATNADIKPPASVSGPPPPDLTFDPATRALLKEAFLVARHERAEHIGTEHLLAALVRTGPPDVVARLAARGATVEAVDALLARLGGRPGLEHPPALSRADRQDWRRATARRLVDRQTTRVAATVVVLTAVVVVVFVLCVWGP
jgi:hypothetical protein